MNRQRLAALVAACSLVVALMPGMGTVLADRDPSSRFTEIDLGDGFTPKVRPYAMDPTQRVTVFVQLQGDSVADVRANSSDNKISDADKATVERDLKAKQDSLRPDIEQRGGTVRGQYQAAVNGIKVEIERGRIADIEALPGVTAVLPLQTYQLDNSVSVPYIGAPSVWNGVAGLRGEGIKIGIIDTGIDYTHANFGGPGTVAAWNAAKAASTATPDPALIGAAAPKVKGGVDLVGDAYNASAPAGSPALIPHPDANPLDCNGHGSHVAGTAAGFGVKADGHTYTGAYDSTTPSQPFTIGPGVAPKADLYAIRVFGCSGSTNVVVDAINWAVDHDMDVINMSLGADFGVANTADALAADKAAKAGVIVVAASGNAGSAPYITSSPASADGAISVAAVDSTASFPGIHVAFGNGTSVDALNSNQASVTDGTSFTHVVVLTGANRLGCSPAAFGTLLPNTLAIVTRGTCARVAKAIYGQQAGAAAVAMINTSPGYPPLEGPITSNPDNGIPFTVTIPFLGIRQQDGPTATATTTATATLTNVAIANPSFRAVASFSSGGPRVGDNVLKPEIAAPGVSILSTGMGTGNGGVRISGTSMATPHVAGVAALTRQAHPTWRVSDIKAAIVNTGNPAGVAGYQTALAGSGLVQPVGSTRTQTVATTGRGGTSLTFGYRELTETFTDSQSVTLRNRGSSPARFNVSVTNAAGSAHTTRLSRTTVTVPARDDASVEVRLTIPAATAGDSTAFNQVAGLVTFTPATTSDNGGAVLRVPYYAVPRALSSLSTKLSGALNATTSTSATATIRNRGVIAGGADFYAWGLSSARGRHLGAVDLRAAGVQSFPSATNSLIVFAVNTWNRWSNASTNEFDVLIDVNGDGIDDFAVIGFDFGAITTGSFNGQMASFTLNLRTGAFNQNVSSADAPMNSGTILLATRASRLQDPRTPELGGPIGLSRTSNPRFSYHVNAFDLLSPAQDATVGSARYNAWTSAISQGDFQTALPGGTATSAVTIDPAEWAQTPALGLLIATSDNASGAKQAQLISVPSRDGENEDSGD